MPIDECRMKVIPTINIYETAGAPEYSIASFRIQDVGTATVPTHLGKHGGRPNFMIIA